MFNPITQRIMKKCFIFALAVFSVLGILNSCSKDDDKETKSVLESDYFTIQNARYSGESLPAATTDAEFTDVAIGGSVINGGSSIVTVRSAQPLTEFYVAASGVEGYFTIDAENVSETRGSEYVYTFTLLVSQRLADEFALRIAALTESGEVMTAFTHEFELIEAGTGALQVNLSFNAAKDLDLYLVLPDGHAVYYGDPGFLADFEEFTFYWGLDVDSNADCEIDDINSENIFFPEEYVMNGRYTVYVNQYRNCDSSFPVSWSATALYKGDLLSVNTGKNPGTGVFRADAPDNYVEDGAVKVMEFTIIGAALDPGELDYFDWDAYWDEYDTRASFSKKGGMLR